MNGALPGLKIRNAGLSKLLASVEFRGPVQRSTFHRNSRCHAGEAARVLSGPSNHGWRYLVWRDCGTFSGLTRLHSRGRWAPQKRRLIRDEVLVPVKPLFYVHGLADDLDHRAKSEAPWWCPDLRFSVPPPCSLCLCGGV